MIKQKERVGDTALVRVEQLYPFPQKEIQAILARYRHATQVNWVQEEPRNRGAWLFMRDRIEPLLGEGMAMQYFGRDEAASPATGSMQVHRIEEEEIIAHALDLSAAKARLAPADFPQQAAAGGE
jgi:2-oxoglutarate dehydrogenase E1 component